MTFEIPAVLCDDPMRGLWVAAMKKKRRKSKSPKRRKRAGKQKKLMNGLKR